MSRHLLPFLHSHSHTAPTHTSRFRASKADTCGKKFCEKNNIFFTPVSPDHYNSQVLSCEIIFLKNARTAGTNSLVTDREHGNVYEIKIRDVSYDGFFMVAFDACILGHSRSSSKTLVRLRIMFLQGYGLNVVSDLFPKRFTSSRGIGVSYRPALRWNFPSRRSPSRVIQQPVFRRFLS